MQSFEKKEKKIEAINFSSVTIYCQMNTNSSDVKSKFWLKSYLQKQKTYHIYTTRDWLFQEKFNYTSILCLFWISYSLWKKTLTTIFVDTYAIKKDSAYKFDITVNINSAVFCGLNCDIYCFDFRGFSMVNWN